MMKVLVVVDGHLGMTPDGKVWSERIYNYDFFSRYLDVFDVAKIAIRITKIPDNEGYPNICSGDGIEFFSIPDFSGPKEYLLKYLSITRIIKESFNDCDCAIFRIPSIVGFKFLEAFKYSKKPYAVEVVVDPWDFAAPGNLKTILRPLIRVLWTRGLKKTCMSANGVSYVTKYSLQEKYPCKAKKIDSKFFFESYYSTVQISENYFSPPIPLKKTDRFTIVHVTNFIGNYVKGHKEIIDAISIISKEGYDIYVDFIGEGSLINEFSNYAEQKNVSKYINFSGKLSSNYHVREKFLKSNLFVFPSHAEGLPRVLIEAMAVSLPCISTNINGIPELLEEEYLIKVGDIQDLASKIKYFYDNSDYLIEASNKNYLRSLDYEDSILRSRRIDFYTKLYDLTEYIKFNKVVGDKSGK